MASFKRMKKSLILAASLSLITLVAWSVEESPLDQYLASALSRPGSQIQQHLASVQVEAGEMVVGVVQDQEKFAGEKTQAVLVVAIELPGGAVRELVLSRPFPFWSNGGRHYVEYVDAPSKDRFSVQINYSGACAGGTDIFRFVERKGVWLVAGRDSVRNSCGSGAGTDESGASREEVSANFLSGTTEFRRFKNDKLAAKKVTHAAPAKLLAADFNPFTHTYGPR